MPHNRWQLDFGAGGADGDPLDPVAGALGSKRQDADGHGKRFAATRRIALMIEHNQTAGMSGRDLFDQHGG